MKELRPFQSECHEISIKRYNEGITKQLICLFTGAGKTFLTIKLLERYGFKRVLWLSYQSELVEQTALAFIKDKFDDPFYEYVREIGFLEYIKQDNPLFALKDFKLGCIKGDIFKPDANVCLGSVQTVWRRLNLLDPDYFDAIVIDECHMSGSVSGQRIYEHFTPKLTIGLSATPYRESGLMMSDIFQEIIFDYGLDKGIKNGYACELDAIKIKTNISLDKVKSIGGDLNLQDLSNEIDILARNQIVVDSYRKYADGRQCICFCVNIDHAVHLSEQFKLNGFDCEAVSSNEELTPDRSEKIKRFKDGRLQIITNVGVLVAGFDHLNVGSIIMACPTKSLVKYLQSVGRGARLKTADYVEKYGQNCILIDIVDSTTRHNLVNAWELDKGLPPEDRVFITQEKRDKLIADRLKKAMAKITHIQEKDERVSLLQLPKIKIIKSFKMSESATLAQLAVIERWGYSLDAHYTKQQISDIFAQQAASPTIIKYISENGYDCKNKFVSVAEAMAASEEIKNRK